MKAGPSSRNLLSFCCACFSVLELLSFANLPGKPPVELNLVGLELADLGLPLLAGLLLLMLVFSGLLGRC